jgi:DNA-directed RNA polymerase specialized sigma24 family protein
MTLQELFAVPDTQGDQAGAMVLAHEEHRYTMAEIARHLGLDRSTVGKRMRRASRWSRATSLISVESVD